MSLEDHLPPGFLLTTVEKWAQYARSRSMWPAAFGLEKLGATPRQADHIVPVDIYLPGCPPRPEMLMDAILKLHDKIRHTRLGVNRDREITELERAALQR